MAYFTQEESSPRKSTIKLIKQIAYTYRVMKMADGNHVSFCLN